MRCNFTFRIYQDKCNSPVLSALRSITVSDITFISKPCKFNGICEHKGNKKKFGYKFSLSRQFHKISGSNSYPTLTFNGDYIDIHVYNFPRYPAFYQDLNAVKNLFNGYAYSDLNSGFPHQLLYRQTEIINIQPSKQYTNGKIC